MLNYFERSQVVRRGACLLLMGSCIAATALAQSAVGPKAAEMAVHSPVTYDVATIKLNKTLSGSMHWDGDPGLLKADNVTLKIFLEDAFDVRQDLIAGLPGWAESAHYDVVAKASEADPAVLKAQTREQSRAMLVQLLVDRFQLKWHIEVKTLPVFEMVTLGNVKFKLFVPKDEADTGGDMGMNGTNHNMALTCRGISMTDLAQGLSTSVGRTVIDKTGLTGKYDLQLKWLRDDAPAGTDDAAPTIYTALQEQLGLKLVSGKGPVNTLVIDSISQPSEN